MIQAWIGVALLAGSWLLGLEYFYPASPWAWLATVVAAVVLLGKTPTSRLRLRSPARKPRPDSFAAGRVPCVVALPGGSAIDRLGTVAPPAAASSPLGRPAGFRGGGGGHNPVRPGLGAGTICQHTAWSHDLPRPLPDVLAGVATLLGIDATADGSSVVMHSMRQVHRLGATWELLLDPATFLFFVGGLTMFALGLVETPAGRRWAAWLPARGLDPDSAGVAAIAGGADDGPLLAAGAALRPRPSAARDEPFLFSPGMLLLLLVVPVLLAWRFVRLSVPLEEGTDNLPSPAGRGAGGEGDQSR